MRNVGVFHLIYISRSPLPQLLYTTHSFALFRNALGAAQRLLSYGMAAGILCKIYIDRACLPHFSSSLSPLHTIPGFCRCRRRFSGTATLPQMLQKQN